MAARFLGQSSLVAQSKPFSPISRSISTVYFHSSPFSPPFPLLLHASRRISNYTQEAELVSGPRHWRRSALDTGDDGDDEDDSDTDDDADDRSLDLLARFLHNVFGKISRRARRAIRSVLPIAISTRLVRFSVNGVLILAFLWVLKALLEVVCTLGSIVFLSIFLIRVVWSGVSHFQENQVIGKANRFSDDGNAWTGAQPAT